MEYPSVDSFKMMRTRHEALEVQFENIKKIQAEHSKRLGHAKSKLTTPKGEKEQAIGDVEDLERFRAEFYAHREQVFRNLDEINQMIPEKVDRKELYDLENKIMIGLRDMMA